MMKNICRNIAFSESGLCLLGQECICASNKLWLLEPPPVPEEQSQEQLWKEMLMIFVEEYEGGIPPEETGKKLLASYTITRK